MGILCWSLVEEAPPCSKLLLLSAWQLLLLASQKLRPMLTLTCFMVDMVDMDSDMLDTIILPMDMLLIMARDLLMPSPRLMLILIFSMVVILTMERDLPMLNPRPMLTPTFFTVVMD